MPLFTISIEWQNYLYPIRNHHRQNVAPLQTLFFIVGGATTGLAVFSCLSFALLFPHSTFSFCYFAHTAWTQISVHVFLFMLIFPSWDRNRCFPSLVHTQDLLGRSEEMAALQCFLMAGCGHFFCLLRLSSSWGRPRAPWPPVLGSAHMHTLLTTGFKVQGSQMMGVQGSVWH